MVLNGFNFCLWLVGQHMANWTELLRVGIAW